MTYEIKHEPVVIDGQTVSKYNIYYTGGEFDGMKEFHSTDGVSGTIRAGYTLPNPPNWLGLEQGLRYSPLFAEAWKRATDKGFSLFTITLINGKAGVASEAALMFAFQMLGVDWTAEEKTQLNKFLSDNNFTIQIQ